MNLLEKIQRHGLLGSTYKVLGLIKRKTDYLEWLHRKAPRYFNPSESELLEIEHELIKLDIKIEDYTPSPQSFKHFKDEHWFPDNYHGGESSGVWNEKLLEHWLSADRLGLTNFSETDVFVDIAANTSPWSKVLREHKKINSYAIDLSEVSPDYQKLSYYRVENATNTTFGNNSIRGMSLHCAYEMFMGQDDMNFITEAARILQPGGKVVILPLYMHTHYCAYSTPEYYGKGYHDREATEYLRPNCRGVPSSRKYNAIKLKERVLDPITATGMQYRLFVLRNKSSFGSGIYCHFILEIEK